MWFYNVELAIERNFNTHVIAIFSYKVDKKLVFIICEI